MQYYCCKCGNLRPTGTRACSHCGYDFSRDPRRLIAAAMGAILGGAIFAIYFEFPWIAAGAFLGAYIGFLIMTIRHNFGAWEKTRCLQCNGKYWIHRPSKVNFSTTTCPHCRHEQAISI